MLNALEYHFMLLMATLAAATPLLQALLFVAASVKSLDAAVSLFKQDYWPTGRVVFAVLLSLFTYHTVSSHGADFFLDKDLFGTASPWLQTVMTWGLAFIWGPTVVLIGARPQLWLGYTMASAIALGVMGAFEVLSASSDSSGWALLTRLIQTSFGYAGYSALAMLPMLLASTFVWLVLNAVEDVRLQPPK